MYRFCLILIAALVLSTMGIGVAPAAESGDGSMDTLAAYLHGHRLPLVEARMITYRDGQRSLLLYGFVATPHGKRDAEDQARDFIDDPDVEIVNRIKIRPELLTLGTPADKSNSPAAQAATTGADDPEDSAETTAAQTEDFPDVIGDREAYANQERDDELLMGNGTGGIPLALAIVGSGFIFPPVSPPIVSPPIYYNGLPPYNGIPPSSFGRPPIVFSSPPPIVVMRPTFSPPPTAFQGFQSPFGPSPFPAGPAPMFPATGGMPPFATTINPGFGGFNGPGFTNHGGFGGGFGIGGGFGGRR